MRILIDMNLSPDYVAVLKEAGFESIHWSEVGNPGASDKAIADYAVAHGYVVFTHDLDFGALLAATRARAPSVLQVRTQNVDPEWLVKILVPVLHQCREYLDDGALISVDETTHRVRILPIQPPPDRTGPAG